jgi:hypothetical protein
MDDHEMKRILIRAVIETINVGHNFQIQNVIMLMKFD